MLSIMISVQKCQFLAISENLTKVKACCSGKSMTNNECLVYIHSLDFNYLCKKNWTIPYFLILIGNRANFAISGLSSLIFIY